MNQKQTNLSSNIAQIVHESNITAQLSELAKKHPKSFFEYYNWAYGVLNNILINQRLVIADVVLQKNIKLFIFIACDYIESQHTIRNDSLIEFSEDYQTISRFEKLNKPQKRNNKWKQKKWRR